jgi:hypothetical protein
MKGLSIERQSVWRKVEEFDELGKVKRIAVLALDYSVSWWTVIIVSVITKIKTIKGNIKTSVHEVYQSRSCVYGWLILDEMTGHGEQEDEENKLLLRRVLGWPQVLWREASRRRWLSRSFLGGQSFSRMGAWNLSIRQRLAWQHTRRCIRACRRRQSNKRSQVLTRSLDIIPVNANINVFVFTNH